MNRRDFDPILTWATPCGWAPEGTYTGNPPRYIAVRGGEVDPWDSSPSKMPYPAGLTSLDAKPRTNAMGMPEVPIHTSSQRHHERQVMILWHRWRAGEPGTLRPLQHAVRAFHSLVWEFHREGDEIPIIPEMLQHVLTLNDGDEIGERA